MISVVIPVRNTKPSWIRVSVKSIIRQTLKPDEIVLVDDGSTNKDTIDCLDEVGSWTACKIVRLARPSGISSAINAGISASRNGIIARMDSDDFSLRERFAMEFDFLKMRPWVDMVGCGVSFLVRKNIGWSVSGGKTHEPVVTQRSALRSNWLVSHPTVMFRRESVESLGGFDESPDCMVEDFEMWARMLVSGSRIENIPQRLHLLRRHGASYSANYPRSAKAWTDAVLSRLCMGNLKII